MLKKIRSDKKKENATVWRQTLQPGWEKQQKARTWTDAPGVQTYINRLVTAGSDSEGQHWSCYAKDRHILPLAEKLGKQKLTMASLGCGRALVEFALIHQFGWPVDKFVGYEYDQELRAYAAEKFSESPECESRFEFFDFNADTRPQKTFDIIFATHSLHHARELEILLRNINRMMHSESLIIGMDFFGPTFFQVEYDVKPIIEQLFSMLPDHLRRDCADPGRQVKDRCQFPTIQTVQKWDPSEAIRSSDLRTLLFSLFPVQDMKPAGGTILRWLLQDIAGNFEENNPEHTAILNLLMFIEAQLISQKSVRSDDLFFVLKKSDRI